MKLKSMFSFKAKVIEPCTNLLSKCKLKFQKPTISLRTPTFRRPRRSTRPRLRTKVVRFRKPFSLRSIRFPRCVPSNKFRLRKRRAAISTKFKKAFHHRQRPTKPAKKPVQKVRFSELLTVLFSLRKTNKEVDVESCDQVPADVTSVSMSERGHGKEPNSSPITPAFMRITSKKESSDDLEDVDVDDSCRSFENYLVEMIVEEGKLKDLMDVEELLYCWRNLKSPVFIDLVCTFYGEVCKDLFSPSSEESVSQETNISV